MAKVASLTAGLMAKKGQALPATPILSPVAQIVEPQTLTTHGYSARNYHKALTVKLDRARYETLKNIGLKLDKKSQEIFVEALDLWIKSAEELIQADAQS